MTTGYDQTGNITFGVVFGNGTAYEYRPASSQWTYLGSGVQALSKERLGLVDLLFSTGEADAFDPSGRHYLSKEVMAVA